MHCYKFPEALKRVYTVYKLQCGTKEFDCFTSITNLRKEFFQKFKNTFFSWHWAIMSPETTNLPKMYLSSKKQKHTFISFGKNVLKFKMLPHVGQIM